MMMLIMLMMKPKRRYPEIFWPLQSSKWTEGKFSVRIRDNVLIMNTSSRAMYMWWKWKNFFRSEHHLSYSMSSPSVSSLQSPQSLHRRRAIEPLNILVLDLHLFSAYDWCFVFISIHAFFRIAHLPWCCSLCCFFYFFKF